MRPKTIDTFVALSGIVIREPARTRLRSELRECLPVLARAIDAGETMPSTRELEAIARICESLGLVAEAARVRRWIA